MSTIHIASFVLLAVSGGVSRVLHLLEVFPEVEVVATDINGKIVFLVEAPHERRIVEIVDALRDVREVLSVSMVEHHVDEAEAMLEEIGR